MFSPVFFFSLFPSKKDNEVGLGKSNIKMSKGFNRAKMYFVRKLQGFLMMLKQCEIEKQNIIKDDLKCFYRNVSSFSWEQLIKKG
jgi:hypothetical protein